MSERKSETAAIELQNLRKNFGDFMAVDNFNAQIQKGEFFSLVGPSGCGKTTTLRMIAGLEPVSAGNILLEGKDVTFRPAYRRNVNTVFQDYAIFPHMNILQNVYFPLKMRKISMEKALPEIQRMLKLVNMEGYESRLPQQLSGGQRQRIALARSLVNQPSALLLDEPLGALDFKLRIAMQKVLKDIQLDVGITFVYVTHDQTEALTMSDRIAVMKDGVVHQIGTPDTIYGQPATAFVASFIGDMNFLYGTFLNERGQDIEVNFSGETLTGRRHTDHSYAKDDDILICVRSENILLNPGGKPMANLIRGELSRIVFRGSDYEATIVFKDGEDLQVVVAATSWDKSLKIGDNVTVGWNAEDLLVFPKSEEADVVNYETGEDV